MNRSLQDTPTAVFVVPDSSDTNLSRLAFVNPVSIWHADNLNGVEEAVHKVETAQQQGYHVVGVIRYEAGPAFDSAVKAHRLTDKPLVWFAAFENLSPELCLPSSGSLGSPQLKTSQQDYINNVRMALDHIRKGNIYQVNYTVRALLELSGTPYSVWSALFDAAPVPHAAYVDTGRNHILSLSPELFLRRQGPFIESKPMKGTASRRPSWNEDEQARRKLERSEKDRAENIMIVDLMRNDLSRICKAGSVHVTELCHAYRFPTVHQMTSIVRGELQDNTALFDIFKAAFPPGSVTGAPKVRATEIIRELEPEPRGIYCGSIGLFFPNGDFTCNVAIRTLESVSESSFHPSSLIPHPFILGLGSGIVIDSDPVSEWQETLVKSKFSQAKKQSFALFETFRYVPGLGFRNLHSHLMRLKHSCDYFSRPFPLRKILETLRDLKQTLGDSPVRIRLELDNTEIATRLIEENLSWPEDGVALLISETRLDPEDPRIYHKTTDREEKYTALKSAQKQGADEVLFLNSRGELCEGSISNVMLLINGQWLTPSLACGLLPGVWRKNQLKSGRAREAILTLDDLQQADKIIIGNSVRGEAPVRSILDFHSR